VDAGRHDGRTRWIKQFPTRQLAEECATSLRKQRQQEQNLRQYDFQNRAVSLSKLTDEKRADALTALRLLDGTNGTLTQAVEFWKKHAAPAIPRSITQVYGELLEAMEAANRRTRTIEEIRIRLKGLVDDYGDTPIARVTTSDLESWLNERCRKLAPRTRAHFRQVLHRLFQHALKRGYRDTNPVASLEKPASEETTPRILEPADVKALLLSAQANAGPGENERTVKLRHQMLPHLAISFFAGLRASELAALDWRNIDLSRRHILVDPATAKKRRARYVKIEPNLLAWITPYRQAAGPVFYSRRGLRAVQKRAGVEIPHNGARHSYGSYHLAAFQDAARTASQLGHTDDTAVLFNHYRALVRPRDARAYWKIKPADSGVIRFPLAASA